MIRYRLTSELFRRNEIPEIWLKQFYGDIFFPQISQSSSTKEGEFLGMTIATNLRSQEKNYRTIGM